MCVISPGRIAGGFEGGRWWWVVRCSGWGCVFITCRCRALRAHGQEGERGEGEKGADKKDQVKNLTDGPAPPPVKALTYKDPFQQVYKKYLFTMDGKYLLGGMMIGDTKDYVKLVPMVKGQKQLEIPPSELIIGASKGEDDGSDL